MAVYRGGEAPGIAGIPGETRLAKTRLDLIDPSVLVLMRDLYSNSDGADSLSQPAGAAGGGGGGASFDTSRYAGSGSAGQPGSSSFHSLVSASSWTAGAGGSGSDFRTSITDTGFYGGGGGGGGGNGGTILISAKSFTIASTAKIKANGGAGGAGGAGGGPSEPTPSSGPGGGGAGGAGGVIIILAGNTSASAGFGLANIELNGGAGGAAGTPTHLTAANPGQAGPRTNPSGVFYIVI